MNGLGGIYEIKQACGTAPSGCVAYAQTAGTSEAIVLSVFSMPPEWTVYGPINGIVFYI